MQNQPTTATTTVSNEAMKKRWNEFAPLYNQFDSCMQTFFYTLTNMLNFKEAKHILEIACGTGKLLPYSIDIKPQTTTYLASDLSENMIELAKYNLQEYLNKVGCPNDLQAWMAKNNLTFQVINGEEYFEAPFKFDRIICNLVLMLADSSQKMMKNLHSISQEGCLLGVTIWGNIAQSNFFPLINQAAENLHKTLPKARSYFYLYNQLSQLGNETGWQIVVQWQQNAPFVFTSLTQTLKMMIADQTKNDKEISEYIEKKVTQIFAEKKTLNFPVQMAILRKVNISAN